jgi:hypothetical protein
MIRLSGPFLELFSVSKKQAENFYLFQDRQQIEKLYTQVKKVLIKCYGP